MIVWILITKKEVPLIGKKDSYDDKKLPVKIYLNISLLVGFSAVLEIYAAFLHDNLQHFLYLGEIAIFRYYMTPPF